LGPRRGLAKRMFQRLTEKAQAGREVRRPAKVSELAAVAEVSQDEVIEVVKRLRAEGCSFLTSPDQNLTAGSVIDIIHESLIRRWKLLNKWATEEAESGQWYRRVEDFIVSGGAHLVDPQLESALQARKKGRWNEPWSNSYAVKKDGARQVAYENVTGLLKKSVKRRNRTRTIVAAVAIVLVALAATATRFWWSAQRNAQVALARQLAADSTLARNSSLDHTLAALVGVESIRHAETVQGYETLWETNNEMGREVARMAHQEAVSAVAFSPDGTLVASGSEDWTARVFEARTGRQVARLAHQGPVNAVAFSPDGTLVVTGSEDHTARVFEARTGREVAKLASQEAVYAVAFSPDGAQVVTGSQDGAARVFEAHTGREVTRLAPQGAVHAVVFSPDGTLVATGSKDNTARVFEARARSEVARMAHQGPVNAVAFSPDGTLVVTGSEDHAARVFEARTGREVARLAHQGPVNGVAFSPDGGLVATGSQDNTARVFDARTGREVARLAHQDSVKAVAFSPDGTLVATGSRDQTAHVFEPRTGREIARLPFGERVLHVAFASGGRFLRAVTGTTDLLTTQDPIFPADLITDACPKLDRNLTPDEWTTYLGNLPYRKTCEHLKPVAQPQPK